MLLPLQTAMKPFLPVLTALSALLLVACGGSSAPTFTDVADAMAQAERARVSKDVETAAAAYEFVLANSDAGEEQLTALTGIYMVQVGGGMTQEAQAAYARLKREQPDALDFALCKRLLDAAIAARDVDTADMVLVDVLAAFPDDQTQLSNQVTAVDRMKKEGPGADLSDLGYAGD